MSSNSLGLNVPVFLSAGPAPADDSSTASHSPRKTDRAVRRARDPAAANDASLDAGDKHAAEGSTQPNDSNRPDPMRILTLTQDQELKVHVTVQDGKPTKVTGQLESAHSPTLSLLSGTLCQALHKAAVIDTEKLVISSEVTKVADEKWIPGLQILTTTTISEPELEKVWAISEAVLFGLTQSAQSRANLQINGLEPVAQEAVRGVVEAAIDARAGCSFKNPVTLSAPHGKTIDARGNFGSRRDRPDHSVEPMTIRGRVAGFVNMGKEHYFLLKPADGAALRIDFEPRQLLPWNVPPEGEKVSLTELARANRLDLLADVTVHKTMTARGKPVYAFVRIGGFESPAAKPMDSGDVFAESINISTENSATNS